VNGLGDIKRERERDKKDEEKTLFGGGLREFAFAFVRILPAKRRRTKRRRFELAVSSFCFALFLC
jgi:hypothetical protein